MKQSAPVKYILVVCNLLLLLLLWWITAEFSPAEITGLLQKKSYLFLSTSFLFFIFAILLNIAILQRSWQNMPDGVRLAIVLIIMGGVFLTAFTAPATHRIYYDEDIYQGIAQNMAYLQKTQMCNEGGHEYGVFECYRGEYNKQPNGYTYLLATAFQLFGTSEQVAFILNNVFLGLSLLATFMIGSRCFGGYIPGLLAALILAMVPENILWHNTTASEPAAALFAALVVLAALNALAEKSDESLFLLVTVSAYNLHVRPESGLILVVVVLLFAISWRELFTEMRFYLFGLFFTLLSIPAFLHVWVVRNNPWGSSKGPFALDYFIGNFPVNFWFYFENTKFPVLFTMLALLGVLHKLFWRQRLVIWIWLLAFWGIFLFFYAGRYTYGADVRYSLLSYIPLALLAGWGGYVVADYFGRHSGRGLWTATIAVALMSVMAFVPFLPYVRAVGQEAWAARADHGFAQKLAAELPERAIVLTQNPGMFHVWGFNASQASIAVNQPDYARQKFFDEYRGGVYFHYNFWCNVADQVQKNFCRQLLLKFPNELVKEYQEHNYRYALYRLLPIK